jgi:hypothetical protein
VLPWQHRRKREPAFSVDKLLDFMLNQCLENTCEGLLHACISSYVIENGDRITFLHAGLQKRPVTDQ